MTQLRNTPFIPGLNDLRVNCMSDYKPLRTGYTTGACAAAAAKAAFSSLSRQTDSVTINTIEVRFPDGKNHSFPVDCCKIHNDGSVIATIIKDAGDDPDITDKAHISATISPCAKSAINNHDFELECGQAKIILRGGQGVGYATRIGPDVPTGKWAINPVPRSMIIENLREAGCGKEPGIWLVEISVKDGEKLAGKTLNPTIGIVGGLSILGTTGIVEPKSHAAYIETIRILLKSTAETKSPSPMTAVFCTGARTQKVVAMEYPALPEYAFIRIGDFIAESLKMASDYKFDQVVLACMPGKLVKYAEGFENTHAHKVKLEVAVLKPALKSCKVSDEICKKILSSLTIREALELLPKDNYQPVLDFIGEKALKNIKKWCPDTVCELRTYDYDGKLLGYWK